MTTVSRIAVTQQEAAEMVGLSLTTIKRAVRAGELPAKRRGSRTTRISVAALEAWFDGLPDA